MPHVLNPAKERLLQAVLEGVRSDVHRAERRYEGLSGAARERYEAAAERRLDRDAGEAADAASALRSGE